MFLINVLTKTYNNPKNTYNKHINVRALLQKCEIHWNRVLGADQAGWPASQPVQPPRTLFQWMSSLLSNAITFCYVSLIYMFVYVLYVSLCFRKEHLSKSYKQRTDKRNNKTTDQYKTQTKHQHLRVLLDNLQTHKKRKGIIQNIEIAWKTNNTHNKTYGHYSNT